MEVEGEKKKLKKLLSSSRVQVYELPKSSAALA